MHVECIATFLELRRRMQPRLVTLGVDKETSRSALLLDRVRFRIT